MLFGSNILEIALAMVFVYLLLSLLCSAIAEYIEAKLNYRASDLEKGIRLLLDPQEKNTPKLRKTPLAKDQSVAGFLYNHPLVKSLYRGEKRPSYIPSRTFALALWDMAFPAGERATARDTHDLRAIRTAVENNDVVGEEVKTALLALIDDAGNDFNKARKNIEDWYDSAMDRVSGWYKRRVQYILLAIGLVTAALINADTINIAKALVTNDALRKSVVAVAEKAAEEQAIAGVPIAGVSLVPASTLTTPANANSAAGASPTATPSGARTPAAANANQSPPPAATPTPADPSQRADAAAQQIRDLRAQLDQIGLPIGWVRARYEERDGQLVMTNAGDSRRFPGWDLWGWVLKVIGISITALAVSQGAPFWFDLLNKIIVIRSTVKPREKSPSQPSKDMPAPETELGKS